jgi:hypothetical protein
MWSTLASVRDPDFGTWWASHRVRGPQQLTKTYHHPVAGTLTLEVQQFAVDTHPDQQLIAYTAEPGSPSHGALHFLLQWSATHTKPENDRAADRDRRP